MPLIDFGGAVPPVPVPGRAGIDDDVPLIALGPARPAPAVVRPPEPAAVAAVVEHLKLKPEAVRATGAAGPIEPGRPIADRIAAYADAAGERRRRAVLEAARPHDETRSVLQAERDRLEQEIDTGRRAYERAEETAAAARGKAKAAAEQAAAEGRARTDALRARREGIHREMEAVADRQRSAVADALAVDRPLTITWRSAAGLRDSEGGTLSALDAPSRTRADAAAEWVSRITRAGDSGSLDYRIGMREGLRAEQDERGSLIGVKPGEAAHVVVHELGHAIEAKVTQGGSRALARSLEFLEHRVGGETPTLMRDVASQPDKYDPSETGRKDKFDSVFDENPTHAYYVGKDYGRGGSEIVSMGLQMLYNDPVKLAEKDPEFFHYLSGILDGHLR